MAMDAAKAHQPPKVAVLVAGMHRSATSLLTQVLVSMGCDAPKTLMAADEHNASGYWESTPIAALNDAILASAGSAWDDWERFNPDWFASTAAVEFHDRAQALLEGEYGDSRLFVLKDPRICRLLPFWCRVVRQFGAEPRIAIPLRNPHEVAVSLTERDAIPKPLGFLLWLRNVLDAEADSRQHNRAFAWYEDMLTNWEAVVHRLGRDLGVLWPRRSTVAAVEIEDCISPSLRHHAIDGALDDPAVSRWTKSAFDVFSRWGRGQPCAGDVKELDSIRSALDEAAEAFGRPILISARLDKKNRALTKEIHARGEAIADREQQIDALNQAVRDRDQHIASLESTVRDKDQQITGLDHAIAERDLRTDRLVHAIAEHGARTDRLMGAIDERDRRISAANETVRGRDRQIAELQSAIADTKQQLQHERAQLQQAIDERDVQTERLAHAVHAVAERDQRIQEGNEESAVLRQGLADRDEAIQALQASTSWRITKPLRWMRVKLGGDVGDHQREASKRERAPTKRSIFYALRFVWRGLPMSASSKQRLKSRLMRGLSARIRWLLLSRAPKSRVYTHSGRLDLADRNYEASRQQAPVPILFDPAYYLARNEDVRRGGVDPLTHYLAHGALEGRLPIDIAPEALHPLISDLHRFDLESDNGKFDPAFYRALHQDIAELDEAEVREHYQKHGKKESRICSKAEFLRDICANPREIPIDFQPREYLSLYPDLADGLGASSPLDVLRHYMRHGRWEPRLHTLRGDASEPATAGPVDAAPDAAGDKPPLCVLAHVYYPELWPELSKYLANLPADCHDLYVNLVDTTFTQELLTNVRDDFPRARVYISPNRGRDIGGHFRMLRCLRMENYRIFCLAHTKKSPHMSAGEAQRWRRNLLGPLLGSPRTARDNIRRMMEDDTIGLLGAARCRYTELNDNPQKYHQLMERMGVKEEARKVDFLSGTMLFARREVLQRLFEAANGIDFEFGDDRPLGFHRDGQWAHAIERAFAAVTRDMNYRVEWR